MLSGADHFLPRHLASSMVAQQESHHKLISLQRPALEPAYDLHCMEVIATIDQGTQSTRVYLYNREAHPIASHHVEFTQHRERAGYMSRPCQFISEVYNLC